MSGGICAQPSTQHMLLSFLYIKIFTTNEQQQIRIVTLIKKREKICETSEIYKRQLTNIFFYLIKKNTFWFNL